MTLKIEQATDLVKFLTSRLTDTLDSILLEAHDLSLLTDMDKEEIAACTLASIHGLVDHLGYSSTKTPQRYGQIMRHWSKASSNSLRAYALRRLGRALGVDWMNLDVMMTSLVAAPDTPEDRTSEDPCMCSGCQLRRKLEAVASGNLGGLMQKIGSDDQGDIYEVDDVIAALLQKTGAGTELSDEEAAKYRAAKTNVEPEADSSPVDPTPTTD